MKKKAIISVIVLLLCIVTTVGLRIATDRASTSYEEVEVTVVSSETRQKSVRGSRQLVYEVVVLHEGQEYDLKNAHGTYAYRPGQDVTVFLSGGKLYANIEGVKTSTPLAMAYFVFLFASFGMVFVTTTFVSQARRSA